MNSRKLKAAFPKILRDRILNKRGKGAARKKLQILGMYLSWNHWEVETAIRKA